MPLIISIPHVSPPLHSSAYRRLVCCLMHQILYCLAADKRAQRHRENNQKSNRGQQSWLRRHRRRVHFVLHHHYDFGIRRVYDPPNTIVFPTVLAYDLYSLSKLLATKSRFLLSLQSFRTHPHRGPQSDRPATPRPFRVRAFSHKEPKCSVAR